MPPVMVSSMRLISTTNILRVATYGRGVWEIDVKQCTAATPTVKALTATTVCSGDSVMLEANTGFTSYRWSNGDTNRRIVLKGTNATASYSVGVEDANGCRAVSSPVNVVINKLPAKPLINVVGKDSLRSTAFGGVSVFQWYKDGVKIDGATSRIYVTNVAGSYTVDVFTAEGCSSRSDAFAYDPNVLSVNEQSLSEMLTAAPQPALDQVTITLPVWKNRVVQVYSITGERVLEQAIAEDATTFGLSTLLWSPGAYIVRMNAANGTASTSLIKQ
jgi:hypothetical protein